MSWVDWGLYPPVPIPEPSDLSFLSFGQSLILTDVSLGPTTNLVTPNTTGSLCLDQSPVDSEVTFLVYVCTQGFRPLF